MIMKLNVWLFGDNVQHSNTWADIVSRQNNVKIMTDVVNCCPGEHCSCCYLTVLLLLSVFWICQMNSFGLLLDQLCASQQCQKKTLKNVKDDIWCVWRVQQVCINDGRIPKNQYVLVNLGLPTTSVCFLQLILFSTTFIDSVQQLAELII